MAEAKFQVELEFIAKPLELGTFERELKKLKPFLETFLTKLKIKDLPFSSEAIIKEIKGALAKLPTIPYRQRFQFLKEEAPYLKEFISTFAKIEQVPFTKLVSNSFLLAKHTNEVKSAFRHYLSLLEKSQIVLSSKNKAQVFLTQLTEKEIVLRERLKTLIESDPKFRLRFANELQRINTLTGQELKLLQLKLSSFRALENSLYRQRLEYDRIFNTLRSIGFQWTVAMTVGLRQASYFAIELLRATGSLEISIDKAVALDFVARSLGITLTDLTKTVNNVYQALINAGQGTSFVAERVREALAGIGISAVKLGQDTGDVYERFWDLIFRLKQLEASMGKAWVAQKLLGENYERLAPLLALSNEELTKLKNNTELLAKSFGFSMKDLTGSFIEWQLLVETLRLSIQKFWLEILKGSRDTIGVLINQIKLVIQLFNTLPTNFKNLVSGFIIIGGPLIYITGLFGRLLDNFQRAKIAIIGLSLALKSLITTHPVLFTLSVLLSGIAIWLKKVKKEDIKPEDIEIYEKWKQYVKRVSDEIEVLIRLLEQAKEKGLPVSEGDIIILKRYGEEFNEATKKATESETEFRKYIKEKHETLANIGERVKRIQKEYSGILNVLNGIVITEENVKKLIEETRKKITESNLSLDKQAELWLRILEYAKQANVSQGILLEIQNELASVIGKVRKEWEELVERFEKPDISTPFLKSWAENERVMREKGRELIEAMRKYDLDEAIRMEKQLARWKIDNYLKTEREIQKTILEEQLKLYDTETKARKLSEEEILGLIKKNRELTNLRLSELEQERIKEITELEKLGFKDTVRIAEYYNLQKQKIIQESTNEEIDLYNKLYEIIEDRYESELKNIETIRKSKELTTTESIELLNIESGILKNLISEISQKIPDGLLKQNILNDLNNKLLDIQISQNNLIKKQLQEQFELKEKNFFITARTTDEIIKFYDQQIQELSNLMLNESEYINKKLELEEKRRSKIKERFEEEYNNYLQILKLTELDIGYRNRILLITLDLIRKERERGTITNIDALRKSYELILSHSSAITTNLLSLADLPKTMRIDIVKEQIKSMAEYFLEFMNNIQDLPKVERIGLFASFIKGLINTLKEGEFGTKEIMESLQEIINNSLTNIASMFGLSTHEVISILNNFNLNLSQQIQEQKSLFNDLYNAVSNFFKEIAEKIYDEGSLALYSLETFFSNLGKAIYDALTGIEIKRIIEEFSKNFEFTKYTDITLYFEEFKNYLMDQVTKLYDTLIHYRNIIQETFGSPELIKNISALKSAVSNFFKEITEKIYHEGSLALYSLETFFLNLGKAIYDSLADIELKRIMEEFSKNFQFMRYTDITLYFEEFKNYLMNQAAKLHDSLIHYRNIIQEIFGSPELIKIISDLKSSVVNEFSDFAKNLLLASENLADVFENFFNRLKTVLLEKITEYIVFQKVLTEELITQLYQAIDLLIETGSVKLLDEVIRETIRRIELVSPIIGELRDILENYFGQLTSEYVEPLRSFSEELENLEEPQEEYLEELQEYTGPFARIFRARERLRAGFIARRRFITHIPALLPQPVYPLSETPFVVNKSISVNFHGLSFNEQRRVFDLWQDKEELSKITGGI